MKLLDLLKGKKIRVMTDLNVPVDLIIKEVKEKHHSVEIGESNAQNDWWPETRDWVEFEVIFTNGAKKSYGSLDAIEILNDNDELQDYKG